MTYLAEKMTLKATDIKTIDSGFSKNSEAQKVPRPSPHMHDKYSIYFELQASLIWFAQQKVVRLQLHDIKVHYTQFRKKNNVGLLGSKKQVGLLADDNDVRGANCVFDGLSNPKTR